MNNKSFALLNNGRIVVLYDENKETGKCSVYPQEHSLEYAERYNLIESISKSSINKIDNNSINLYIEKSKLNKTKQEFAA